VAEEHLPWSIDLTGAPLLTDGAAVAAGVAEGSPALLVAASAATAPEALAAAAEAVYLVIVDPDPSVARDRAEALVSAGALRTSVVVEVAAGATAGDDLVDLVTAIRADGLEFGVSVEAPDGVDPDGWEIGVLTLVLPLGPATVRGVTPGRIRRIRAVLAALAGGTASPSSADARDASGLAAAATASGPGAATGPGPRADPVSGSEAGMPSGPEADAASGAASSGGVGPLPAGPARDGGSGFERKVADENGDPPARPVQDAGLVPEATVPSREPRS
jgi:hypothetical protein